MILIALRLLLAITLMTGAVYPVMMFAIGQMVFPGPAGGSLLERGGVAVGSSLIAQKFQEPRYLHGRPTSSDFATMPAGASNLAPTSIKLASFVKEQKAHWGDDAPADLLSASGSGLDPHISPRAVLIQVDRIASARHLDLAQSQRLRSYVNELTEGPELGFLGPERVNVLQFNLKLDELFP